MNVPRPAGRNSAAAPSGQAGFTLIELLITGALLLLVAGVVLGSLDRPREQSERDSMLSDARQSARAAVQLLERDVHTSGSAWGGIPVVVSLHGVPDTLFAITPGPGAGPGSSDSLRILREGAARATLTAALRTPDAALRVDDISGFAAGDMVVVSDRASAHLFEVTGVDASARRLEHHPSSPWNPPGGFTPWPPGGYGAGARVVEVETLSYRVDSTSFRRPALVRLPFRGGPEVVAFDVDRFQVWYRMRDGRVTRDPELGASSAVAIDRVRPVLTTRAGDRWRAAAVDSVWAEVEPRTP